MTIRITRFPGKGRPILRLEGHLDALGVEDLKTMIQGASGPVHLDLSDLLSADAEGVRALQSYSAQGVKLFGTSPYIRQLLHDTSTR